MLPALAPQQNKNFFTCACRYRLAPLEVHNGRTVIPVMFFGMVGYIDRIEITCPVCGQVRRFSSSPVRRKPRAGHA